MTPSIAKEQLDLWKMVALASLVLSLGWAHCVTYAEISTSEASDANEVKIVKNVWVDVPLMQVLQDISMETGVAIVTCPHVPDPLVSLDTGPGKPFRDCMQELLSGRGLIVHKKSKKLYFVSCGSPTCPSSLEIADYKRVCLKYISAKHLKSSLPKSVEQYVTTGERGNEVLIYAAPEIAKHIMGIVTALDVPRQQVELEVLVVELSKEDSKQFGLDWEYADYHNLFSMEEGLGFFTGTAQYTSVPKSQLASLLFTLRALVGENKATIRSRPRVTTQNGEKAVIDISLEEYFTIVIDTYGAPGRLRTELEKIKSGVTLAIKPNIGNEGDITVDVATEVSDIASRQNQIEGNMSGDLPIIRRRKVDTCVRVKDGDAIVIGGLIETQERTKDKRVPVLSSIPLVGGLFTSKEASTINKEVIIFITPRLINEGQGPLVDGYSKINVEKELKGLQNPAPAEGQYPPDQNSTETNIERNFLDAHRP
jgi:type IV pilus assembly protein PilQ